MAKIFKSFCYPREHTYCFLAGVFDIFLHFLIWTSFDGLSTFIACNVVKLDHVTDSGSSDQFLHCKKLFVALLDQLKINKLTL